MSLFVCWMVTTDFLLTRNYKFSRTAKCIVHLPIIMISLFCCPHLSIKPLCGTCLGHHSLVVDTRPLQVQAIRHAVKLSEYYTLVFSFLLPYTMSLLVMVRHLHGTCWVVGLWSRGSGRHSLQIEAIVFYEMIRFRYRAMVYLCSRGGIKSRFRRGFLPQIHLWPYTVLLSSFIKSTL